MRRAWVSFLARFVGQLLAVGTIMGGCAGGCPTCHPFGCSPTPIVVCAPVVDSDAGLLPDANRPQDTGPDARDARTADAADDAASVTCTSAGRGGAHCFEGTCAPDLFCATDRSFETTGSLFSLRQAVPDDPLHPGYPGVRSVDEPALDVPFTGALGSLCVEACDLASSEDPCGPCGTCSGELTQSPLVAELGGALIALDGLAPSGTNGLCRIDCTYDRTTRGAECPELMTCSAFTETCIEQCVSDAECNARHGITYEGEPVSLVDEPGALRCNPDTGRCEALGNPTAMPGDRCASADDCSPDGGVCLVGNLCAQSGCEGAGGLCAGDAGVCLGVNDHQSLCVRGCNTPDDCGGGNACQLLSATIGTWAGFCYGLCDDDSECMATETCSSSLDALGAPVAGRCVPRCTSVFGIGAASGGCADHEACMPDHDGATYGLCVRADRFCGAADAPRLPSASAECAAGWVCDELLASGREGGDGHCVPACTTDVECEASPGAHCVLAGPYAGLCRVACIADEGCPVGQACDAPAGECVEL